MTETNSVGRVSATVVSSSLPIRASLEATYALLGVMNFKKPEKENASNCRIIPQIPTDAPILSPMSLTSH